MRESMTSSSVVTLQKMSDADPAALAAAAEASVRRSARVAAAAVAAANAALALVRAAVLARQAPRVLRADGAAPYCAAHPHAPRTRWHPAAAPLALELAALALALAATAAALRRLCAPAGSDCAASVRTRARQALAASAVLAAAAGALGGSARAVLWLGGVPALAAAVLPALLAHTVHAADADIAALRRAAPAAKPKAV